MVKRGRSKRCLSKSSPKKKSKNSERDFKKLILDGKTYLLNDTVNIFEVSDPDAYGRILRIYTQKKDQVYLTVRWFYKPKDIFGDSIPPYISQNELFESDLTDEISVVGIIKKADIINVQEYSKLPPSDSRPYFYRARYLVKTSSIEPILEAQDSNSSELRYIDSENNMAYYNIYSEDLYKNV